MSNPLISRKNWVPVLITALGIWAVMGQSPTVQAQGQPLKPGMFAPDLTGGVDWLGVKEPLSLKDLRGKFVILDFWTLC
jgi:hypothetical protein